MLEVNLFGQFDLRLDNQPLELSSRPAQMLLAYLLLNRDVAHPRGRLAGVLWPDVPEESARRSLRNALYRLRQGIGDDYIVADRRSVAFNRAALHRLDVALLEEGEAGDDSDALLGAVEVYRGELLPGFYEEWVLLERERLRALFERQMERLLDGLAAAGRWAEVEAWAERWIGLGHVPEPAYRALMAAHAERGDMAGAAASYRRCVEALEEGLGVPPSEETQELYRRLSAGERPATAPERPAARPEEPALAAGREGNLPAPATPFFGRRQELDEIGRLLEEEADCRLLTLVGPGGIGKTRLALEAARTVAFEEGAWFISLAPLGSSASLVSTIADGLGLRLHGSADPREQLAAYLANRHLLLLLDNFEHLLAPLDGPGERSGQDGAALMMNLLERASGLKIVVTSRERLNLRAEWVFPVEGLEIPEDGGEEGGAEAAASSAVQLFLQRARQLRGRVGEEPDEVACAARICRLVGGMPLAIELAAAWRNTLSCREIAGEIERSLGFLRAGLRDVPERHRDIRAVFDSSWKMLGEAERRLFRRLSVFRGGFTRAAAEAVGGEIAWSAEDLVADGSGRLQLSRRQPQVLAALARLVDKSFVRRGPSGRYDVHELMRQYGAAKLLERPEEEQAARNEHARYYRAFIVHHENALRGPRQREVLERVSWELDNVKAAWKWTVTRRRLDWLAGMMSSFLWLLEIRNDFQEAAAVTESAVKAFRAQGAPASLDDPGERDRFAYLLGRAGWYLFRSGQTEPGRALSDEGLALIRPGSEPKFLWEMTVERSYVELAVGNLGEACRFAERAKRHAEELASPWHMGFPIALLGIVALQEGDAGLATKRLQESLALWLEVGDPRGLLFAYTNLGAATLALGRNDEALAYGGKCLSLSEEIGDRWSQANALTLSGRAQTAQGAHEDAAVSFRESAALHREAGDLWGAAEALVNLGNALLETGDADQARAVFREALSVADQGRAVATGLGALVGLARLEAETKGGDGVQSAALAAYVASHPQANEATREAARRVQADVGGGEDGRFDGTSFGDVARALLAEASGAAGGARGDEAQG